MEQVGIVCGDIIAAPPWKCMWAWHWPVVGMLPWGEGLQVSRQSPTCPLTGHPWSVPRKGSAGSQHSPIPMELGHEGAEEREARTRLFCFCVCWLPLLVTHTCSQTYTYMCSHTPGHTITHSHTFTQSYSHRRAVTHGHTQSHIHTVTHIQSHTDTCSHTWSHTVGHIQSHRHMQSRSHSHKQPHTLLHTYTVIHTHAHSHTHTDTHPKTNTF